MKSPASIAALGTPGSTAPLSSFTVPLICAVACARAALACSTLTTRAHEVPKSRIVASSEACGPNTPPMLHRLGAVRNETPGPNSRVYELWSAVIRKKSRRDRLKPVLMVEPTQDWFRADTMCEGKLVTGQSCGDGR